MSRFEEYKLKNSEYVKLYEDYKNLSAKNELDYIPEIGEKLVYKVYWTGLPAGEIIFSVTEITEFQGEEVFKIVARVRSNNMFSIIYNIDDTFVSYIKKDDFYSMGYRLIRNGAKRKKEIGIYNYDKSVAEINTDGKIENVEITGKIYDSLSSLYYFRTKNLTIDDKFLMDINADSKNLKAEYRIIKFGKFNLVNLGVFDAFLVKLSLKENNKTLENRKVKFWVSADKRKIPLTINIDVPLGYLKAVLREMQY